MAPSGCRLLHDGRCCCDCWLGRGWGMFCAQAHRQPEDNGLQALHGCVQRALLPRLHSCAVLALCLTVLLLNACPQSLPCHLAQALTVA